LRTFKFFEEYKDHIHQSDWILLGFASNIQITKPYHAMFVRGRHPDSVFFNIQGNVAVTMSKKQVIDSEDDHKSILTILPAGSSFGELAVIYGINRYDTTKEYRTATCLAYKSLTINIVIDGELFKEIFGKKVEESNKQRYKLLAKSIYFRNWPKARISGLIRHSSILILNRNDFLIKEGDLADKMFIVAEGEISLVKQYNFKNENVEKFRNFFSANRKIVSIIKVNSGKSIGGETGFDEICSIRSPFTFQVSSTYSRVIAIPKEVIKNNIISNDDLSIMRNISETSLNALFEAVEYYDRLNIGETSKKEPTKSKNSSQKQILLTPKKRISYTPHIRMKSRIKVHLSLANDQPSSMLSQEINSRRLHRAISQESLFQTSIEAERVSFSNASKQHLASRSNTSSRRTMSLQMKLLAKIDRKEGKNENQKFLNNSVLEEMFLGKETIRRREIKERGSDEVVFIPTHARINSLSYSKKQLQNAFNLPMVAKGYKSRFLTTRQIRVHLNK